MNRKTRKQLIDIIDQAAHAVILTERADDLVVKLRLLVDDLAAEMKGIAND